jgi:uncharacterized protein (TIGR02452 family)
MSLKGIAQQTLDILDVGSYEVDGRRVEIAESQREAVAGTRLYRPADLEGLIADGGTANDGRPAIAVTPEKTQVAARRLVQCEGVVDLVVLNFASARNVGGGFRRGAKAQEEDLARSSGLYRCLESQPDYYAANRADSSLLYTDHVIYSPRVPWFREHNRKLLPRCFLASIITAPAPNAGEHLARNAGSREELRAALRRRAAYVLAVAEANTHRTLLLGAWGCGVFRNDPAEVADAFISHLESDRFRGSFTHVCFAIFDSSPIPRTLRAFEKRAAGPTT